MASFTEFILNKLNKDAILDYLSSAINGDNLDFKSNIDNEIAYRIKEHYVWYKGSSAALAAFYKKEQDPAAFQGYSENNFWRWSNSADTKVQKVHLPIASQISQSMSTLVFDDFPRYFVDTGNQDTNLKLTQSLEKVFNENNFTMMCQEGAQLESYSGALACKFTLDTKFSNHPIIEFYPFGDFEVSEKYGKVFEIIFKDHYRYNKEDYILNSIYGRGYINYKLFKITKQNKQEEVDIRSIPETSELKNIVFVDEKKNPIPVLMAAYKVNRASNPDKPGSTLGSSDYSGLTNVFDAIDCIASMRQNYFRYGARIPITISEDNIAVDKNGNIITNLNELDILILKDSNPADTIQTKETKVPTLSDGAFSEAIANLIGYCCDRCGISRTTFGVEQAGRNASAESLSIRQDANYRTRQSKVKLWTNFISDIMKLCLIYGVAENSLVDSETNSILIPSVILDYSYVVEFAPFEQQSNEERAASIKAIEDTGYISHEDAIRMYYEPLLEAKQIEEKVKELIEIKEQNKTVFENNIKNTDENIDTNTEDTENVY